MSDSIIVRVTLGSYDMVHPAEKQTQVYVQIPEVARATWLLDSSFYAGLKNESWPHVVDEAHNDYVRRGVVTDSASAAARQAVVEWLLLSEGAEYDARYDAVQAAWEADQAHRHPVARKLLKENETLRDHVVARDAEIERLRARVAELEALAGAATGYRLDEPGYGLLVRRAPGPDRSGWAVLESRRTERGRRAWTSAGWKYSALMAHDELFCWPSAEVAVAEARRVMPGAVVRAGEDVTPQVRKLRSILAGQREQAGEEAAPTTVYRASHDSIVMGLYTSREAAMHHCEAHELRDDPVSPMFWRTDEDGTAELFRELVPRSPGAESATGFVVTPLEVAASYDEGADE
ncbi:hypothetical protein [Streptomyces sp. C1-2]|uniref:hypothetical protein n=1 Tax=Streptomyces sp. C1-2 TaxID=2720022 RepID=UPI001F0D2AAD|nr:hypothetical protein [Streptomyces sp. C1-2]